MINKCIDFIQSRLFPLACLSCGQNTDRAIAICHECEQQLPFNASSCRQCSSPLQQTHTALCGHCQKNNPAFHSSHIPFRYESTIQQWIKNFKFNNDLIKGKVLSDLFCETLSDNKPLLPEVLIPVPLHPSRIRQRGYNQALFLARTISKKTGIPVDHSIIRKIKKTPPQHKLDQQTRLTNIRNAFSLAGQCNYQHIAIIDDVVTTTATVNEVSRLLTEQGVEKIQVWAIARSTGKLKSNYS